MKSERKNRRKETALIRVHKAIKEQLEKEAERNHRSVVEEASLRLNNSFKAAVDAAA